LLLSEWKAEKKKSAARIVRANLRTKSKLGSKSSVEFGD
jgi:hypothetical protein